MVLSKDLNPFGKIISCLEPNEIESSPSSKAIFTTSRNSPGDITPPFTINLVSSIFFSLQSQFSVAVFSLGLVFTEN